jgi:ferrous iron transport protein B
MVNIVPRTANLIPFVNLPEVAVFGLGEGENTGSLEAALTRVFSPLAAVAFTAFVLLYTPCMTTVAAMKHEFGWRWTIYQMLYTAGVAWLVAVLVYQGGTLLGFGG